jgi:type I restriction enzyme R subunit
MKMTSEAAFETAIDSVLLANGYACVDDKGFGHEQANFPDKALQP